VAEIVGKRHYEGRRPEIGEKHDFEKSFGTDEQ